MTVTEPKLWSPGETDFSTTESLLTRRLRIGSLSSRVSYPRISDTGDDLGDWWSAYLRGTPLSQEAHRGQVRTLDLFCGPGGLALGFGQACAELGYEFISQGAVDDDTGALDVYAANHSPEIAIGNSVRSLIDYQIRGVGAKARFLYEPEIIDPVAEQLVGQVDAVLAGPPCQGHSNLNNHSRRTDRRNSLYLTVPAFAIATGAPLVVIENVPAVVHDRQQVVESTRTLLQNAGYEVVTGRIRADRLGWPQTRQRMFLIARKDAAPVDLEELELAFSDEPRSVWWAIGDLEDEPVDDRLVLDVDYSEENRSRIDWLFDNDSHDLPNAERPDCHREGTTYNAVYGRMYEDRPAPTITSGFLTPGRGRFVHPTRRRTLTPHEAARLQGFPDGYVFHPQPDLVSSKAQLTKWIGDAVPMPLGFLAGLAVLGGDEAWVPTVI